MKIQVLILIELIEWGPYSREQEMNVQIENKLREILRLGVLRLTSLTYSDDEGDALWQEMESLAQRLHEQYQGQTPAQIPGVSQARTLYRSIGLDPTRTRPSSEALLRRAVQGKPLYRVHPIVDLFNIVSLETLLPVGLYDESKIVGNTVKACLGREGWRYEGIRKDSVNVGGRFCLVDEHGPFGSPTSDSQRTAIDGNVPSVIAIIFQPNEGGPRDLDKFLDRAVELSRRYLQAEVRLRHIFSE